MDYFELIEKRKSVRGYKKDPVEKEKLDKILESARLAPTAVNKQPFKIFVIETEGQEEELKKIYRKDWFVEAPLILGICLVPEKAWVRRDQRPYGDIDVAIVMDHMILAATALGLGSCWVGAFDAQAAREFLKLDDSMEPIAFTPIGYAPEVENKRIRKSIEELVVYQGKTN